MNDIISIGEQYGWGLAIVAVVVIVVWKIVGMKKVHIWMHETWTSLWYVKIVVSRKITAIEIQGWEQLDLDKLKVNGVRLLESERNRRIYNKCFQKYDELLVTKADARILLRGYYEAKKDDLRLVYFEPKKT